MTFSFILLLFVAGALVWFFIRNSLEVDEHQRKTKRHLEYLLKNPKRSRTRDEQALVDEARIRIAPELDPPASEVQRSHMDKLGLSYAGDITTSQATDLIGTKLKPEPETLTMLKFFGVATEGMHQTAARYRLAEFMDDPNHARSWRERPAAPEQLDQLEFYGEPIPEDLYLPLSAATRRNAEIIEADPKKADAWANELSRREAEESAMFEIISVAPNYSFDYGLCGQLRSGLAWNALKEIMAEGVTVEDVGRQCYAPLFQRAVKIDPSILRDYNQFTRQVLKVTQSSQGDDPKYKRLVNLKKLLDGSVITQEEFEREKAKVLNQP